MKAGRQLIFGVIAMFFLGLAFPGLTAGMSHEVKGTVTKIDGGKVTIKDGTGSEKTVEPTNPGALKNLKVGDQASVKDGVLTVEIGAGPSAPPAGPKY